MIYFTQKDNDFYINNFIMVKRY